MTLELYKINIFVPPTFESEEYGVCVGALTVVGGSVSPTAFGASIMQADNDAELVAEMAHYKIRKIATSNLTIYIDNVLGADNPSKGFAAGSGAFASIQYAYNCIAQNYDLNGYNLIINLTTGQTYTTGLFLGSDLNKPVLVGGNRIILDGNNSKIASTNDDCIQVRNYATVLQLQNLELTVLSGNGSLIHVNGGGSWVNLGGGMIYGSVPAGKFQLNANRNGHIATMPRSRIGDKPHRIKGGGGVFLAAIMSGIIEFEGQNCVIDAGLNYDICFVLSSLNSHIAFADWGWLPVDTVKGVTGQQYIAKQNATILTNYQTGSFTACKGNKYLAGSIAGEAWEKGGVIDDKGSPYLTPASIAAGCTIIGSPNRFTIILPAGLYHAEVTMPDMDAVAGANIQPIVRSTSRLTNMGVGAAGRNPVTGQTQTLYFDWTGASLAGDVIIVNPVMSS